MKTLFLQEVVEQLGLQNVTVLCERIENVKNLKFNCITARAVASLTEMWRWCYPLLHKNGRLLAMKGGDLDEEISQFNKTFQNSWQIVPLYDDMLNQSDKKLVIVSL